MNKINIIQFLPYFPPHKGGLETHAEERGISWIKNSYGSVINLTFDVDQEIIVNNSGIELIRNANSQVIGYKQKGYIVYFLPSFELIHNFPFPKFWKTSFWQVLGIIKKYSQENISNTIIQTRTRFFLSSFIGGLFARIYGIRWVHIEHGSDYVKLSNKFFAFLSYIYDKIIGRWIFKNASRTVAISEGVKSFLNREFSFVKDIEVIHRGVNFIPGERIENDGKTINIGFVGRLVKLKGVDLLIQSFADLSSKYPNIRLHIVGDGDEMNNLVNQIKVFNLNDQVIFYGYRNSEFIANEFLNKIEILANFSWQEGLPSNIIEGLLSGCICVATDVGGTREISREEDFILVEKGNLESMTKGLEKAITNYKILSGLSTYSVKEKFSWDSNIKRYYEFYNNLK